MSESIEVDDHELRLLVLKAIKDRIGHEGKYESLSFSSSVDFDGNLTLGARLVRSDSTSESKAQSEIATVGDLIDRLYEFPKNLRVVTPGYCESGFRHVGELNVEQVTKGHIEQAYCEGESSPFFAESGSDEFPALLVSY